MYGEDEEIALTLAHLINVLDEDTLKRIYIQAPPRVRNTLDSNEVMAVLSERMQKKGKSFLDFFAKKKSSSFVSDECTGSYSADVCVRMASEHNEGNLVELFLAEGATDVLGSLVTAAENGSEETIRVLSAHSTEKMFDIAASHAAYGGHYNLMIELYASGTQSETSKRSILQMAIRAGQRECADYILKRKMEVTDFEVNLLGKNLKSMRSVFKGIDVKLNPCSIASFGTAADFRYIMKREPDLFAGDQFELLICALENNNETFISLFQDYVTKDSDHQRLYYAAAVGGNEMMMLRFASNAARILPGIYLAIANRNLQLVKKLLAVKNVKMPDAAMYAGYSGSDEIVSHFVGEATIEAVKQLAIGAAAGGNYDLLKKYYLSLGEYANWQQYFVEAMHFSRYNLLERLYSDCKDILPEKEVKLYLERAHTLRSKLTAFPSSTIHPMMTDRVNEILRK